MARKVREGKKLRHAEGKLRDEIERGRRAEEILADPLVQEAFDSIEKTIEMGWKNSSGSDREARDNAYLLHRLLTMFRGHFKSIMVKGSNAKALLAKEEEAGARDAGSAPKPGAAANTDRNS